MVIISCLTYSIIVQVVNAMDSDAESALFNSRPVIAPCFLLDVFLACFSPIS